MFTFNTYLFIFTKDVQNVSEYKLEDVFIYSSHFFRYSYFLEIFKYFELSKYVLYMINLGILNFICI